MVTFQRSLPLFPKSHSFHLGGSSPNDLRYVQVPAITNAQCNQAYDGDITSSMMCAGYPGTGGKDACQGMLLYCDTLLLHITSSVFDC